MLDIIKQKITRSSVRDKIEFVGYAILGLILLVMLITDWLIFILAIGGAFTFLLLVGLILYLIMCHDNNEWVSFRDFIEYFRF